MSEKCRLCESEASWVFSLQSAVAGTILYYECRQCGSLQTQVPTWLAAAYADGALGQLDTGALYRSQLVCARLWMLARPLGIAKSDPILDVGGASGVLSRLLRDLSFEAFVEDPIASDIFNRPFRLDGRTPAVITAVEVVEHFASPADQLAQIFDRGAGQIILSTQRYDGQDSSWYYLTPASGQHVFFYSSKAMMWIADRFGYDYVGGSEFHLFSKGRISRQIHAAFRALTSPGIARVGLAALGLMGRPGRVADQERILLTRTAGLSGPEDA